MNQEDHHGFSSDRPIENTKDDLLGRAGFSKDLAYALSGWHGRDSLVVALHGDWGSGKSSIKNMAVSELKEIQSYKPDIIDFSPWEWAAQERITEAFFQEISATVGYQDKSEAGRNLATLMKKYGHYLNTGESIVTGISAALPTLFVLAATFGLGSHFLDESWVKTANDTLLGVTVAWAVYLKWGANLLKNIAGSASKTAKDNELSLSQLRSELSKALLKRTNSLLVIMDDLDRLTSEQLRMVFQLVKANAEFPNVVFLLLFQRDLVEEKLDVGKQTGRDFLQKIIQVPFDIPKIETARIHDLLFKEIDKILEQYDSAVDMFDSGYWGNLFYGSLNVYFDNLRSVYRFSSTLSFHFSLLRGKNVFEVNPVDLIAIECLRVFEPEVYKELSRSKEIFTTRDGNSQDNKEIIERIVKCSTKGKEKFVEELIDQVFPNTTGGHGEDYFNGWLREMRVCHRSNFDKYFQFSIPSGEISNSELLDMVDSTASRKEFILLIQSLKQRNILKNALSQFNSYTGKVPLENAEPFIKAILDVGDSVDHDTSGFAMTNSNLLLTRITILFLKRNENLASRGQLLLKCFKESDGLSIVENILQADENRREKPSEALFLADSEFEELKQEFVEKMNVMATDSTGVLIGHEHLGSFLYRWKRWGDEAIVSSWLKCQLDSYESCLRLLINFISTGSSQGISDYVAKTTRRIKLENIEEFLKIEEVQKALNNVELATLDSENQDVYNMFQEAVSRREKT